MRRYAVFSLGMAAIAALSPAAIAHGVDLVVEPTQALRVRATYDSGDPMADAAVVVYAPDDPAEPWVRGATDAQGYFTFTPDPAIEGDWGIQVRQAGHGNIVSVPLSASPNAADPSAVNPSAPVPNAASPAGSAVASSNLQSPLQKGLMIGSVFWGCLGTALFFSARTRPSN
ncbi:MAG: carboxypeptidase regulatory-like domain-containing protein [Elainellaceae cyanobacterium]